MANQREELEELLQRGFRYALSLAHDEGRAEDLLQDACVSILRAGGPFHIGYLFRAIRNRFIDQCRRERIVMFEPVDGLEEAEEDVAGLDDLEIRADMDTLERALGALRAEEREAIYLAAVEGYTVKEISELTGRSPGTVSSAIFRARRKVAEFFGRQQRKAIS